jgi:spore germination cell wall hydrolase CwlJ-like protein
MKYTIFILLAFLAKCTPAQALTDQETIVLTLLGEARCQPEEGMTAIAQVILNRSREQRHLPVASIVLQPRQWSCWNNKRAFLRRSDALMGESETATNTAKALAFAICNGIDVMPDLEANHYYNSSLCNPSWAKYGVDTVIIGDHTFMTL